MYTPAHVLVNAAIVGAIDPRLALPAAIGAALPDVPLALLYARERLRGTPEARIWSERYGTRLWQDTVHTAHSLPLAAAGLAVALALGAPAAAALCGSLLLHDLGDLPIHGRDAHRHFLPLSQWRFLSPLSYWELERHAAIVELVEVLLAWAAAWTIARRGVSPAVAAALAAACLYYPWKYWSTILRPQPPDEIAAPTPSVHDGGSAPKPLLHDGGSAPKPPRDP